MDPATVAQVVEVVGLPVAITAIVAVLAWKLGGRLLAAMVDGYRERIAALQADRDHFRDRSEAAEDRTAKLCASMVDALRKGAEHE
jgi:hypothetical protein